MTTNMLNMETVKLIANQVWMNETVDMTLFVIKKWSLVADEENGGI